MRLLAALAAAVVLLAPEVLGAQTLQIAVDNLASRDGLGGNVSAVLNLQIWKTLRRAPYPNPSKLDFGSGTIYWFPTTGPAVDTAAAAEALVLSRGYDMLLWGAAQTYGDGVAVDAYLTAPRTKAALAVWTLASAGGTLSLSPPRDIYVFAPVRLTKAVVQAYTTPGALTLCTVKTQTCADPRQVGPGMRALRQEGEWSFIKPEQGEAGWLKTPDLGPGGNDITNFAGALVSYGRGDFEQAARLFRRVAASPTAGAEISADAAGLAAAALARFGDASVEAYIEAEIAKRGVSPFLFQVAAMQALDQAAQAPGARDHRQTAARYVERASLFLDEDDPWLIAARRLAGPSN